MIDKALARLAYLCLHIPSKLLAIAEPDFVEKRLQTQWSKKEMLGHLIDSATNNHQRFVRVQFEDAPAIFYDQENWVICNFYQDINTIQLINFWHIYNLQLIELIKCIPAEKLTRICRMRNGDSVTLDFLVNDYVEHLEHHLHQIVDY